jgi:hypothetical protein
MRNVLIVIALVTMLFGPTLPTAAAPSNAFAATKNVRATALADCQRQARAMRLGSRTIQRRNFLKDCMIDRGFYGDVN